MGTRCELNIPHDHLKLHNLLGFYLVSTPPPSSLPPNRQPNLLNVNPKLKYPKSTTIVSTEGFVVLFFTSSKPEQNVGGNIFYQDGLLRKGFSWSIQ